MRLSAHLARKQLSENRRRAGWTLLGIILSVSMITAVYSFGVSGYVSLIDVRDGAGIRYEYIATIVGIAVLFSAIILTATVIELAQMILGYGLVAFLAFMGSVGELDVLRMGVYQLFWFAAIFVVQQIRQV